jgi:hypothetical protein
MNPSLPQHHFDQKNHVARSQTVLNVTQQLGVMTSTSQRRQRILLQSANSISFLTPKFAHESAQPSSNELDLLIHSRWKFVNEECRLLGWRTVRILRNVGSYKIHTAPHPRRQHSSQTAMWKPHILRKFVTLHNWCCSFIEVSKLLAHI